MFENNWTEHLIIAGTARVRTKIMGQCFRVDINFLNTMHTRTCLHTPTHIHTKLKDIQASQEHNVQ